MNDMQNKLLEMLKWFDNFCRQNELMYYAIGGTLLGAMRHKGFIPWDDDIDIGMPRNDYERLSVLALKQQSEFKYIFETVNSPDENYCYTYTKLYDTTTTLIENVKSKLVRGIYLDVFPIDGLGNGSNPDMIHFKKIIFMKNLFVTRVTGLREGRSAIKNAAVRISRLLPDSFPDTKELRIKIDQMCKKYNLEHSQWAGNLLGIRGKREIVPVSYFGEPKECRFEDIMIFCVEEADSYLTSVYGDWRKLPPIEKQESHHDYIYCDLSKSYLEWKEDEE